MKTIFSVFFLISLYISEGLCAQNLNCDPNTCTIKSAGKYKIELAGCDNYLDIYVLDTFGKPIENTPVKGSVEFFYLDETSLVITFKQFFKTNSLRAKVPCSGFYNCRITLTIETDICEVYFDNECNLRAMLK